MQVSGPADQGPGGQLRFVPRNQGSLQEHEPGLQGQGEAQEAGWGPGSFYSGPTSWRVGLLSPSPQSAQGSRGPLGFLSSKCLVSLSCSSSLALYGLPLDLF